jgi:hypothetical protein
MKLRFRALLIGFDSFVGLNLIVRTNLHLFHHIFSRLINRGSVHYVSKSFPRLFQIVQSPKKEEFFYEIIHMYCNQDSLYFALFEQGRDQY